MFVYECIAYGGVSFRTYLHLEDSKPLRINRIKQNSVIKSTIVLIEGDRTNILS